MPSYEHDGTTFNPFTDRDRHNAQRHRQTDGQSIGYDASTNPLLIALQNKPFAHLVRFAFRDIRSLNIRFLFIYRPINCTTHQIVTAIEATDDTSVTDNVCHAMQRLLPWRDINITPIPIRASSAEGLCCDLIYDILLKWTLLSHRCYTLCVRSPMDSYNATMLGVRGTWIAGRVRCYCCSDTDSSRRLSAVTARTVHMIAFPSIPCIHRVMENGGAIATELTGVAAECTSAPGITVCCPRGFSTQYDPHNSVPVDVSVLLTDLWFRTNWCGITYNI